MPLSCQEPKDNQLQPSRRHPTVDGLLSTPSNVYSSQLFWNISSLFVYYHLAYSSDSVDVTPIQIAAMAGLADDIDNLHLQEENEDDTWDPRATQYQHNDPADVPEPSKSQRGDAFEDEDREAALWHELKTVRDINSVIERVVESLDSAKENMGVWHFSHPLFTSILICY